MSAETLSIMVVQGSDNIEQIFVLGADAIDPAVENLKKIFSQKDIRSFLTGLDGILKDLKGSDKGLSSLGDAVNVMDFGAGQMITVDLSKVPSSVGLLKFAKRVWKNPKKQDEVYISYEISAYKGDRLANTLQRVLVMKENMLYDVTLKV